MGENRTYVELKLTQIFCARLGLLCENRTYVELKYRHNKERPGKQP